MLGFVSDQDQVINYLGIIGIPNRNSRHVAKVAKIGIYWLEHLSCGTQPFSKSTFRGRVRFYGRERRTEGKIVLPPACLRYATPSQLEYISSEFTSSEAEEFSQSGREDLRLRESAAHWHEKKLSYQQNKRFSADSATLERGNPEACAYKVASDDPNLRVASRRGRLPQTPRLSRCPYCVKLKHQIEGVRRRADPQNQKQVGSGQHQIDSHRKLAPGENISPPKAPTCRSASTVQGRKKNGPATCLKRPKRLRARPQRKLKPRTKPKSKKPGRRTLRTMSPRVKQTRTQQKTPPSNLESRTSSSLIVIGGWGKRERERALRRLYLPDMKLGLSSRRTDVGDAYLAKTRNSPLQSASYFLLPSPASRASSYYLLLKQRFLSVKFYESKSDLRCRVRSKSAPGPSRQFVYLPSPLLDQARHESRIQPAPGVGPETRGLCAYPMSRVIQIQFNSVDEWIENEQQAKYPTPEHQSQPAVSVRLDSGS
ncbi:hypothetical protein B0H12DRAFT_1068528 [Mycena haematopus]|nr:hypothetical protein B0H12DRAFT_1068528 [Mycena haematopus]